MNDMSANTEYPQSDTLYPAPFSDAEIGYFRKVARKESWPKNILYRLQADVLDADRAAHLAKARGDSEALSAAIMARIHAQGRMDAKKRQIAEVCLRVLSLTWELFPDELSELFGRVPPTPDTVEMAEVLAEVVAELKAMKGVA